MKCAGLNRSGLGNRTQQSKRAMVGGVVTGLLAVSIAVSGAGARSLDLFGPSPATGHSSVIAQGVAELPTERLVWQVVEREADVRADATAEDVGLGFVVAVDEPVLTLDVESGRIARLAPGEATLTLPSDQITIASLSNDPVDYLAVELVESENVDRDAIFSSERFRAPEGLHDLDLVRDVLARDGEAEFDAVDAPILVYVVDGSIDVEWSGSGDAADRVRSGDAIAIEGDFTITNAGRGDATYLAAVIGPEIPAEGSASRSTSRSTSATTTSTVSVPTGTPTPVITPTRTPDTGSEDPDGDGLTNEDEATFGTDPANSDTDRDGIPDWNEINEFAIDPLSSDTDWDGLSDFDELYVYFSHPGNSDGDGDGMTDWDEVMLGTDPWSVDTDGDGLSDFEEINGTPGFLTNPLVADSDGDTINDADEQFVYRTSPLAVDTDADWVNDDQEIFALTGWSTDARNYDTDGDGMSDGAEIYGASGWYTSPLWADGDNDGYSDPDEIAAGTNPNSDVSHP